MRTISDLRGDLNPRKQPEPRLGTTTRRVYDVLLEGRIVRGPDMGVKNKDLFNIIERLRQGYDLRIENLGYDKGYKLYDHNLS